MGAEKTEPQLLEKLMKRIDGLIDDFSVKNQEKWVQVYEEEVDKMRNELYTGNYQSMEEFNRDFN